ncbi:histidine kinase dimerization/phosphoacceptor domain -containing protein [Reichenbachiella agariperforans]|uniref:histidine kinase dimerization/phosphoacceptor domain -containing protein n=1 Tax=Reichenbachiella agariperforans TaxID=156994 RepID=UPI001C0A18F2|nr:histidine kinase dimerization/phosphoacceptor domain -containing protein [Reichenbachiella agariperforans]MBU2912973.1 tetratricopeptide repeat protein [Reichenbachiella agariperforans]
MNRFRLILTITLSILSCTCWSQDKSYIDSLKAVLIEQPENLIVLNDLAYEYTYKDLDSARVLLLKAIEINENDSLQLGISKETLAIVDEIQGNISDALVLHFESIEIFEQINSPKHLAWAYNGVGALHYQQYDYDQALTYFLKSMNIRTQLNNPEEVAKSKINIALIFNKTEQYDSSLFYLHSSLAPFVESADQLMESIVYLNLGSTFSYMEEFDSAEYYFNKSEAIQKKIGDHEGLGVLYRKLGELYSEKNELLKALDYYTLSLEYIQKLGDIGRFIETKQAQYLVYETMKDYENAYRLQSEYLILRDSLINIKNKETINEYNAKYEAEQKERVITELELEQKSAALALANSQNQRNVFVSGFTILIIFAGFLYQRYTSKKKTSELLTNKNIEITHALEDRETLLKEIHHRVKNNLQVISSLLNLQAGSLDDEAAIDAVKEGQNRVKSMALIHQRLYSADDIRGVDIHDYIENLVSELFTAFGTDRDRVESSVSAHKIKMDIDTVIPLGLILNELITNCLKYAFGGIEHGRLDIEIKEIDDILQVMVRDNGVGMDEETMRNSNSFGWKMIKSLSRKLKAEIIVKNENGTIVYLNLSRYKLVV